MKKIIFAMTIGVLAFSQSVNAQLKGWVLPIRPSSNQTTVPYLDFRGSTPVLETKDFDNPSGGQTVGNAEYCNNCASSSLKVSDLILYGLSDVIYNGTAGITIGTNPVGVRYEPICVGDNIIEQTPLFQTGSTTDHLTLESLSEMSMGNGPEAGTFWIVSQVSTFNQFRGTDFQISLFDPSGVDIVTSIDINQFVSPILRGMSYNEGVALGSEFTYTSEGNITDFVGKRCRSIYVATYDSRLIHIVLNTEEFLVGYGSSTYYGDTGSGEKMGIETSFPIENENNNHPKYVATSGWNGVHISEVNENGDFTEVNVTLSSGVENNTVNYDVEFDKTNAYLYLAGVSGKSINRYDMATFNSGTVAFETVGALNITGANTTAIFESAANGNIYLGEFNRDAEATVIRTSFSEIKSPSTVTPIITELVELNDLTVLPNSGLGFPDWVDGEAPLENTGKEIEVCLPPSCNIDGFYEVQIKNGDQVVETKSVLAGECSVFYVCPNISYDIYIDGEFVKQFDNLTSNVTYSHTTSGAVGFQIGSNEITSFTKWEGTVYVSEDITVDGAVLDVTNCDVIFTTCAKINFINGASIRANNSVFRPCDQDGSWDGLYFESEGINDNVINECTFKRAQYATSFRGNSDANIHGNLFLNCTIAIRNAENNVSYNNFNGDVTSNEFVLNDSYVVNECHPDTETYFIKSAGEFNGNIVGNDLHDNSALAELKVGIELKYLSLACEVRNNTITDATIGIHVRGGNNSNGDAHIIGNKVINSSETSLRGLIIQSISNPEVSDNEIISNGTGYGIELIYINNFSVKSNYVSGHERGIYANQCFDGQIIDNKIDESSRYGIYVYKPRHLNTSCNEIDLDMFSGSLSQGVGIRYYGDANSLNNKINSNCLLNSVNAMYLYGIGADLPEVRNNFMYNYSEYGIYCSSFSGFIGTASLPGMNTFYSNSTAVDLRGSTSQVINVYDNFNLNSISGGINVLSNSNEIYSTASCSPTVFGTSNQENWGADLLCDDETFLTEFASSARVSFSNDEEFSLEYSTSSEEVTYLNSNKFEIFPNPVLSNVNVHFSSELESLAGVLSIQDVTGKEVFKKTVNVVGGVLTLSVTDLESGLYVMVLKNVEGEVIDQGKFFKSE